MIGPIPTILALPSRQLSSGTTMACIGMSPCSGINQCHRMSRRSKSRRTKNAELNEHRKAVERLLSVEEEVVEATDLQPDSFFELAFDGE